MVEAISGLVVIEMSMSLDGFVAGPDDDMDHKMGKRGGDHVFDWLGSGKVAYPAGSFLKPEGPNRALVQEMYDRYGAFVSGRRTYDLTEGWGGRHPLNGIPGFILTHNPDPAPPRGETQFTFVTDGIESAIRQATAAAAGKDVYLLGASPGQQALAAGLVDELLIHVAPILLGAGVRMFDNLGEREIGLEQVQATPGPHVAHLRYSLA